MGVWQGSYQDVEQPWLRWYDRTGNWILTSIQQERQRTEQERQRAEQERQRTQRLIAQLKALGVEPDLD